MGDPESAADTMMTARGSPEAESPDSDSSDYSSEESTSSEETGTPTTMSGWWSEQSARFSVAFCSQYLKSSHITAACLKLEILVSGARAWFLTCFIVSCSFWGQPL